MCALQWNWLRRGPCTLALHSLSAGPLGGLLRSLGDMPHLIDHPKQRRFIDLGDPAFT